MVNASSGAAGALIGALAGHFAVLFSQMLLSHTGIRHAAPQAPVFFTLALYTACMYGGLGAGMFREAGRFRGAILGFFVAAVMIAAPMIPLSFLLRAGGAGSANYRNVHLLVYLAACAATVWTLGTGSQEQGLLRGWKAGLGALGGALAAQAISAVISAVLPGLRVYPIGPMLPPPAMLIEAVLCGSLVAAGTRLLGRARPAG